ncbi:hypothetical protein U1Q18_009875 [Sarracenia purpurea var. burkii]
MEFWWDPAGGLGVLPSEPLVAPGNVASPVVESCNVGVFASPKLEATKSNIASNRADVAEEVESRTPNHSDVRLPHKVRWKVGKGGNVTDDPQVSPALFPDLDCGGKKEAISVGDGVQAAAIKEISSQARQVFVEMPQSMPEDPSAGADAGDEDEENRAQGIFILAEAQGEVKPLPQQWCRRNGSVTNNASPRLLTTACLLKLNLRRARD